MGRAARLACAPAGWTPPSGWTADPSWPSPPPDWTFWRSRLDRLPSLRAWRILVVVILFWAAGNAALAIGLRHHATALRRFLEYGVTDSTFTNPWQLVFGGPLLLIATIVGVAVIWSKTFGVRHAGWPENVVASVLLTGGFVLDGRLLRADAFYDPDRIRGNATLAIAAAVVGACLVLVAVLARQSRLNQPDAAPEEDPRL